MGAVANGNDTGVRDGKAEQPSCVATFTGVAHIDHGLDTKTSAVATGLTQGIGEANFHPNVQAAVDAVTTSEGGHDGERPPAERST